MSSEAQSLKKQAAEYTVNHYIESGMIVGLGEGSTSRLALECLADNLKNGKIRDIIGIPTSEGIRSKAAELGISLSTLDEHPVIDLTFDGADEVDPNLNLIKGGGGSLLREKIVAQASRREIIMVDESKLVPILGATWALPIEVLPFGLGAHVEFLKSSGGEPVLRKNKDGSIYQTNQNNYILDTNFGKIENPAQLGETLKTHAGIVEHGLFIGLATAVVVAGENGIRVLTID